VRALSQHFGLSRLVSAVAVAGLAISGWLAIAARAVAVAVAGLSATQARVKSTRCALVRGEKERRETVLSQPRSGVWALFLSHTHTCGYPAPMPPGL
jgi:hypothetical protein